ncbi:DUF4398 domain-containing protein [Marinicella sp. W31]|uniref:DUF4398 domain-containing protein n=1 Tax=Marinicella sp. W31 TaxID=3023713 RepID=UPI003757DC0E
MTKNTIKSFHLGHKFRLKPLFSLVLLLSVAGCTQNVKVDTTELNALNARYEQMRNSEIADSAPVEMKFIGEKLERAFQAMNSRDNKTAANLAEQIELDFQVAETRAMVNRLNDELLDAREKVLEAEVLLDDLTEQLQ